MSEPSDVVVTQEEAGMRVDVFLAQKHGGLGRARAKALVESGQVRVDGRRARKGDRLRAGALVTLSVPETSLDLAAVPDPGVPLAVVYEDDALVVVDKPAGVPTHPLRPGELGTLANGLLARYPEVAGIGHGPREPGIVHRLDVGTSGLVVAARTPAAFEAATRSLREGRWQKAYLALVAGAVRAPLVVDAAIAPHPSDARRVRVAADPLEAATLRAKAARTDVAPIERFARPPLFTLVEARARAARRHQVRAHLAFVGHPLAGDVLYGGPAVAGLDHHFLHATSLALPHPTTGDLLALRSALPETLAAVLASLRGP